MESIPIRGTCSTHRSRHHRPKPHHRRPPYLHPRPRLQPRPTPRNHRQTQRTPNRPPTLTPFKVQRSTFPPSVPPLLRANPFQSFNVQSSTFNVQRSSPHSCPFVPFVVPLLSAPHLSVSISLSTFKVQRSPTLHSPLPPHPPNKIQPSNPKIQTRRLDTRSDTLIS